MAEKSFFIPRDPWDTGEIVYKKSSFTIRSGVTVLVGCNGAGKSTLIHRMQQVLKDRGVPTISFDNLTDGGDRAKSAAGFYGDISFLATAIQSSEGENIIMNIGQFARKLGSFIRKNQDAQEIWAFLDAVDSGLSIDNINDIKKFLHDVVLNDVRGQEVYIVISANVYEFARGEECFDVQSGKYIRFSDYEDYRDFVFCSRREKDLRGEKEKGNG